MLSICIETALGKINSFIFKFEKLRYRYLNVDKSRFEFFCISLDDCSSFRWALMTSPCIWLERRSWFIIYSFIWTIEGFNFKPKLHPCIYIFDNSTQCYCHWYWQKICFCFVMDSLVIGYQNHNRNNQKTATCANSIAFYEYSCCGSSL